MKLITNSEGVLKEFKTLTIEQRVQRDALKYERYKDQLPLVSVAELGLFRLEVKQAYERIFLIQSNLGIGVRFVSGNPYETLADMTKDITESAEMLVSTDFNDSLLLPGELNLQFRAIHDYLHYLYQQAFDFTGEFNVYKVQKMLHSTLYGRKILYSEIVLQAAYCTYFGKFADKQKVIID